MAGSDTLIPAEIDRFDRLVEAFSGAEPTEAWIRRVFERFGVKIERWWEPYYGEDLAGSPEDRTQVLNEAFTALVGDGECFDTSLDLLLSIIGARNPQLDPLRRLVADLDFDVELPETVRPVEYGLLGLWSAERFAAAFEAAGRFDTPEAVRGFFAERRYGVAEKMRGLPGRDRKVEKEWLEEDFWSTWNELLDLGLEAARTGSHLALVSWD